MDNTKDISDVLQWLSSVADLICLNCTVRTKRRSFEALLNAQEAGAVVHSPLVDLKNKQVSTRKYNRVCDWSLSDFSGHMYGRGGRVTYWNLHSRMDG